MHDYRSPLLGTLTTLQLSSGPLDVWRRGEGRPVVFTHGWLTNANLWRRVVDRLADRFACFALDLPLGGHRTPMDDGADLSPRGVGELIAEVLDVLDLRDVTLVGNDSGGAYSQIAVAHAPQRIARLVLNSCETPFDEFPPPPFDGLPAAARDGATLRTLLSALEDRSIRRADGAFGLLSKRPVPDDVSDSYALPALRDDGILRDTAKAMSAAASEPVHLAGRRLIANFDRPVLLPWSPDDRVFPFANARRYADALPEGRVVPIGDAYSLTAEDQPDALADALAGWSA
jgi:pimeloyl-ACP methyl ester carboxylesterase